MTSGSYFSAPTGERTERGSFAQVDDLPAFDVIEGLTLRPLLGQNVMLNFARYEPGAEAPRHAHVEEQLFVVLEGEFEVDLDGDLRTLRPGGVAVMPSWLPHRVRAGTAPAFQLDVFSPPRQGLLELLAAPNQGS